VALRRFLLFLACCLSGWITSFSQTTSLSPYSRYGLGEIRFPGSVKQIGMGRTGVAVADPDRINALNPAALSGLDAAVVEGGFSAEVARQSTDAAAQTVNSASIRYFSLAFPVIRNVWGAGLGVRPYSSVGYSVSDIRESETCQCGRLNTTYAGDGDITAYSLSSGYAPFARRLDRFRASALHDSLSRTGDTAAIRKKENGLKALGGLSVGIQGSWLFGTLNHTRSVDFLDSASFLDSRFRNSLTLGDVVASLGLLYKLDLGKDRFFNLGVSVSPASSVAAKRNVLWYTYRSNAFFDDIRDTVQYVVDEKGDVGLPLAWSAGIAIGRKNAWTVSGSYETQQWSKYEVFGVRDTLLNSTAASAGVEWIPSFGGPHWIQNIWYRLGGYYTSSYLQLNGHRINDYGITLGLGIPVLKADQSRAMSPIYQQKAMIQLAVEAGRTGTRAGGLLEQQYVRFHVGIVFKELWFIKRKYD